jgi:Permease for cytosine/purines, uracil, thiamine, allantoin
VPRGGAAEITPVEPDLVRTSEGSFVKTETPAWGIEPVPDRYRLLGFADSALLWGNLGVSLLVLVAAAFLVPALSLQDALIAIVAGSLIGNLMLGTAGLIGADARVPGMVLMRAPLGQRGSYGPTALNVAQSLLRPPPPSRTSCSASRRSGSGRSCSERWRRCSPSWAR